MRIFLTFIVHQTYDINHSGALLDGSDAAENRYEHHDDSDRHQQVGRREEVRIDEVLEITEDGTDGGSYRDDEDRRELERVNSYD